MKKIDAEDALAKSADVVATNVDQLKVLFPEAVKEGEEIGARRGHDWIGCQSPRASASGVGRD